jgi:acetylornithine/N-succinyldiaminopimelate aminotransferase
MSTTAVHTAADLQAFLARAGEGLIANYARLPVVMTRGEGSLLWDSAGRQFIDLFAGFGGGVLGHCHPELVRAVNEQASKLWHVGNTYHSIPQTEFAESLRRTAFDGKAFFCHSGLEANEAAVKLARLRGLGGGGKKWKTVSLIKSFHGRSLAMIAATGNPAVKEGFGPPVPGFTNVDPIDFDALTAAVDDETACIIMEPIQGEGGINLYPEGHLRRIRDFCDARQLTLIFDEVWTGCGRTGKWFGHQWADGVTPDIMTLGKAVGGGLPVGVMFARSSIAPLLSPGKHGCTLGGNMICMAVAKTIFDVIERDRLIDHTNRMGNAVVEQLNADSRLKGKVAEIRGRGLFLGIELHDEPKDLVARGIANGVVINLTAKKIIRIAPPINIDAKLLEAGIDRAIKTIAG